MAPGKWILGGILASQYALGYRVVDSPVANMKMPLQIPVVGTAWDGEDHLKNQVAQLYGDTYCPVPDSISRAASAWSCPSGTPPPDGLTGQCNSRQP